ncbi:MAG: metallophosphoesterase [Clostridia bacterium]|nr:metallophosphoesterase [Clostridia bacterium]
MGKKSKGKKRARKTVLLGKLLALLPASCILLYPLYLAAQLDSVEEDYVNPALPGAFEGLRLAFVSDIHYGALLGEDRVRALVRRVNAWQPDVILLGGDYGEDSDGALAFWRLRPGFQAKICVAATVGNHDRTLPESNLEKIKEAMRANDVIPLVNDAIVLDRQGQTLALTSTDDFYNGCPDLPRIAALCARADFTVFFPHNPDILAEMDDLPGGPFYQLALCGHTHGGQVALFGHALHSSSQYGDRYLSGWYRENGTDILVSNGVGTSMLPVRLGARPQIHLLTLRSRKAPLLRE